MVAHARIVGYEDSEERGAGRARLLLHAEVDDGSARGVSARVHNVSRTGFLIEMDSDLRVGAELQVEFADVVAPVAKVVWRSGTCFGCQFRSPVASSELEAMIASSKVLWPQFGRVQHGFDAHERSAGDTELRSIPAFVRLDERDGPADGMPGQEADGSEVKYPAHLRFHFIIGLTALLWGGLALGVWLTTM